MSKKKTNRQHKDTLFKLIFENKEYALQLYNAVNGTGYTDVENLRIVTLKDAMYISVKNDVGIIFHDILSVFEAQSTYNPNMPLRGLGYIGDSLKEFIAEAYDDQSVLYHEKLIHIPTPKYYVFYNGTKAQEEEHILKLSEAYDGAGDVEVIAHMLNINKGHNRQLMEACKPLADYAELVDRVRIFKSQSLSDEAAAKKAVSSCIEDGILADILRKERAKVENILIAGLNEEQQKKVIEFNKQYAIEMAVKNAVAETKLQAKLDTIRKLIEVRGDSIEDACEFMGMTVDEFRTHINTKDR